MNHQPDNPHRYGDRKPPPGTDELNSAGLSAFRSGQSEQGARLLSESLRINPNQPFAHVGIATFLLNAGRPAEALDHLNLALQLNPRLPEAHYVRGNVLLSLSRHTEAIASYDQAVTLEPTFAAALNNRGTALHRSHRLDEALLSFQQALRVRPAHPGTLNNLANLLRDCGDPEGSIALCDQALALRPAYPGALTNKGNALLRLHRQQEAIANFDRALAIDSAFSLAWQSKGVALSEIRLAAESIDCLRRAFEMNPQADYALANLRFAGLNVCDWTSEESRRQALLESNSNGANADLPFTFLSVSDRAAAQLRCARTYVAREGGAIGAGLCAGTGYAHDRIRLAYLSGDFRDHAVAFLITGALEQHDRQRFETIALSLRPEDPGHYGQRIKRAAEHFIDVSGLSDAQAAARIRELEVDILVDLAGFTRGARCGILARRPAPIQVNYLGFPATLGAPYIDYLIADEFLIPVQSRPHYAEHIAYLPECFQANDDQRPRSAHVPTRSEAGLPASAIVLCCFNNSYKINPTFFSVWMRLLQATADSVLWLVADEELTQQNLRREAQQRGVDPQRLIFAARLPYAQHLARLALADLFLDTLPFNGGTTVSDALWASLPVLTCAGEAMAARMAGSLLHSIGLSELISFDLAQYERLALELLHDRPRLAALRSRIASARSSATLFNTARLTRHLEAAYRHMHQTHQQHLPAQHFTVPAPDDP